MYIICFISVVNRTYQVLLSIQHVLFQQSIGHTRYYYVYNIFYFSSQQDIPGTIMYITCFISVVNRTYQVPLCIQHILFQYSMGHTRYYFIYNMFYFSSQQDILGTIMYITCFISVVNRTYQVLSCILLVLFQLSIGHTRYYYVYKMLYFSSQQDILGTIMYITCFISVVNRTYYVLLCIQHVLFQQSIGHTRYYYVHNMFYFSRQQDILCTIMYITCFISVVNRTYQVLSCILLVLFQLSIGHTRYYYIYKMLYFSSQQDILGTIMYITCFISVVNRTYYVLLCIQHVLFQQSIGHTRYYYVHNMFYFSRQQDILCTIMYITCFISVVNRTYQVLLCI